MPLTLSVLVHTPAHSGLGGALSYASEHALAPGTLVRVPLGARETLGVVWDDPVSQLKDVASDLSATATQTLELSASDTHPRAGSGLKAVSTVLSGLAPLHPHWRALVSFAASYYQRSPGEVALSALPPQLRDLDSTQLALSLIHI